MALAKKVKKGGIHYEGKQLVVNSGVGDYVMALIPSTTGHAVNSVSITPDSYGAGDTFALLHVSTTATVGGETIAVIATSVYNLGGGVTVGFDFASLELVDSGESIRFVYTNTATIAMNVYATIECIK